MSTRLSAKNIKQPCRVSNDVNDPPWCEIFLVVLQMDDGYLEQFPIGAISHIGLPESTLPKEVRLSALAAILYNASYSCDLTSRRKLLHADNACFGAGGASVANRLLRSA